MTNLNLKLLDSKKIVVLDDEGEVIDPYNNPGTLVVAGENNVTHVNVTVETPEDFTGYTFKVTLINALRYWEANDFSISSGFDISDTMTYSGYTTIYISAQEDGGDKVFKWEKYSLKIWSTSPNYVRPASAPLDPINKYDTVNDFPLEGKVSYLYVAKDTGKSYRWSGSDYVIIPDSIALGETSNTAYAGSKGKYNSERIAENTENINNLKGDIENIVGLKPSGSDTEANIRAFTVDKGIYVGTDTGKWYYWNSDLLPYGYIAGGEFVANPETMPTLTGDNTFKGTNAFEEPIVARKSMFSDGKFYFKDMEYGNEAITKRIYEMAGTTVINEESYVQTIQSKDGTVALLSDVEGKASLTESNNFTGTKNNFLGKLTVDEDEVALWVDCKTEFTPQTTTTALDTRLSLLETLIKPTYYFVESVDTFITRETAEGQNIIDGSNATISSIAGHSEVCSNLLSIDDMTGTKTGVTISISDNVLTINGTAETNTVTFWIPLLNTIPAGTYIGNDIGETKVICRLAKENLNYDDRILFSTGEGITTPFDSTYISITVAAGDTVSGLYNLMLNSGTAALPFEPYYSGVKSATATTITSKIGGENLVTNGDFSDGITGWVTTGGTMTVADNILTYTPDARYKSVFNYMNLTNKSYYCVSIKVKSASSQVQVQFADNVIFSANGNTDFDKITYMYSATEDSSERIYIQCLSADLLPIYIKDAKVIDVTDYVNAGMTDAQIATMIESHDYETSTYAIPTAITALDGYGVEGNIVDFEEKTFTQNNEIIDNAVTALATPVVTDISEYIVGDTYKVWKNGTETFDTDVAPTLTSTYFVSRITEEN